MSLPHDPGDAQFRAQARTWLLANKPRESRPSEDFAAQRAYDSAWQRTQFDGGWAGIGWPVEYGGRGLSMRRQLVWYEEYAKADAPLLDDASWLGVNHAGPTLIARGTEAQKKEFLLPILRGDETWCQGFSEPDAGSDLAALRTRGVVDGGHLVITGQKTWTTYAHLSDRQELLVRTDPGSTRFRGLTWLIADMRAPGVTIRPIRSLTGEHENCEVFYDEVRLPLSRVVGAVNDGWSVAMTTLAIERGTASFGDACQLAGMLEQLIEYARSTVGDDGRPLIANDALAQALGEARAEMHGLHALLLATVARAERGTQPGSEGSFIRLYMTETAKRVWRLAMEILGVQGLDRSRHGRWIGRYLGSFALTIAGGSSEIQRNIIGERVLGLPR